VRLAGEMMSRASDGAKSIFRKAFELVNGSPSSRTFVSAYAASVIVRRSEAAEQKALFRRDLKCSSLFVLVGAAAMYVFDRITGANYWFMNAPSADSPLAPIYERGGFGAYLLVFLLAAAAGAALCFGLRYLFSVRGKKDGAF